MSERDLKDWLALTLLPGLGPISLNRLLERFENPAEVAYRLPTRWLSEAAPRSSSGALESARQQLRRRVDEEWKRLQTAGIRLISRDCDGFPAMLAELPDAPILLYVRGTLAPARPRVALVGSRAASRYGRRMAAKLAAGLVERGIEIVSGGAAGIDTAAHRGALDAGGSTLAVFGSGLLRPYPVENGRLFDQIAGRGALISEYPTLTAPSKSTFPRRNRLVSGLSAAIVVVEAAARSGALITARQALEQGREVLAVPGPASSSCSAGANRLIQEGAKLVLEIEDVIAELPALYRAALPAGGLTPPATTRPALTPLSDDESTVIALLDEVEPMHVDQLAAAVPFNIARLQSALFGLQLQGAVDLEPGRYYLRRPLREADG